MTQDQFTVFAIIAIAMAGFAWGRIRYDVMAIMALLAGVFGGVVPVESAFTGFSHAAVITVAAVLVISRALQISGVVDYLVRLLAPTRRTTTLQVGAGSALGAALSCVMNNVGALALMLPVTLRNAVKARRSPSLVLMPLSFATLLGGMVTLIGTPPNIVISGFRKDAMGTGFQMFDFAPVGLSVAIAGIVYLFTIGWRFLPARAAVSHHATEMGVESYTLEATVPVESQIIGMRVRELEAMCENEVSVMAVFRNKAWRLAPPGSERFRANDVIILEGDPSIVTPLADGKRLEPLGDKDAEQEETLLMRSDDVQIVEVVVMPNSALEGRSARGVRLHARYGINLLALSRAGSSPMARLRNIRFRVGDVLLLQGEAEQMEQAVRSLGCLVLERRGLQPPKKGLAAILPVIIFGLAIFAASAGLTSVPVAFATAVVALIVTSSISLGEIYSSIEWPVIVLLGAMIPIGQALDQTGGTALIANAIVASSGDLPMWAVIGLILVASMLLSDLVPNATTAILMAPIGLRVAEGLGANPDAFLMAVAVGAAAPFLTPIGHQSNTLVMGPGGYKFTDYARMGLGMEIIVVLVAVPAIMMFWPM